MGRLAKADTRTVLERAHRDQVREAIPPAERAAPEAGAFNVLILFNLEAAFDEGHAILGLGPVDGPIQTYSYYRHGNALRAPALMADLRQPMTFRDLTEASGWIVHGQPGNYWNEHVNAALAMACEASAYERIHSYAEGVREHPGTYDLVTHNCLGFVEDALREGGMRLVTHSGRPLHSIVPKDAFEDAMAVRGAMRFGAWKYWFPRTPAPSNGLPSIPD